MNVSAPEHNSDIFQRSILYNVKWFISIRWLAAISITVITFIAVHFFQIGLEQKRIYIISLLIFCYNVIFFFWFKKIKKEHTGSRRAMLAETSVHLQIISDMVALWFLIHFSGGIESPFLFVSVFHPIFASIILSMAEAYLYSLISIVFVGLISFFEYLRIIPHYHPTGLLPSENISSFLFSIGTLFSFAIIQITAVVITSIIMKDLRKKQNKLEKIKQEVEEKNKKLMKKDEVRLLFLASVTHDLKSPLNTIASYIQSMIDGYMGAIPADQTKVLQRILTRINGLRELINDILTLGEIEIEEVKEARREKFDIVKMLLESVEEFKNLADARKINIIFKPTITTAFVNADPAKTDEVIHNYISNAIKYNKENGTIMINAEIIDSNIKISISDTGIGIKDEDLPRLFSDFFRSSDVKKMGIEGTGLGLGISKRIIEKYGGSVGVISRYQEGSTFYFTLPVVESEKMATRTT